jgi:TetR/AcrR family transcriptional regulator, cholesterol catabolism regulator
MKRTKPGTTGRQAGQAKSPAGPGTVDARADAGAASPRLKQIQIAASRLFQEKGFEATSMNDIADAVKITKAGLYHFVDGKEDLLFSIMTMGMDTLHAQVVVPAMSIEDPLERLKLILRNHLRNVCAVPSPKGNPITNIIEDTRGLGPQNRRIIEARKKAYVDFVQGALQELSDAGHLPGIDVKVATYSLIGLVMWTPRWRRPGGRLSLEEITDSILGLALGGVLSRKPR